MTAIGPGSLVRCVTPIHSSHYNETVPTVGGVYRIREVVSYPTGDGYTLAEIINQPRPYSNGNRECSFWVEGFTPIDDSAIDIFRRIAEPTKVTA